MKRFVWSIVLMAVTLIMCGCEKDYYEAAPEETITYTSTDGKAIEFYNDYLDECDARVIANFYQDGVGYILFDIPVTYVGGLFYNQDNLLSVTLPYGVKVIGGYAFSNCTSLTSVTIPNSVTEIGGYAFSGCSSLTSVTIPNSVTEIEFAAFAHCTSLTSVTIPNSVTEIEDYAFDDCTSLKSVYCKPTIPPTVHNIPFDPYASRPKIYVPRASVDKYKSADGWSKYASDIVGYDF